MSDIRGHRFADPLVDAQPAASPIIRYLALALVVVSTFVWIGNRGWSARPEDAVSVAQIREVLQRAGFQPTGTFSEQITGAEGVEALSPSCSTPLAFLPVLFSNTEIAPDALQYGDGGYSVAYAFDGALYPENAVSLRTGIAAEWKRLKSLFVGSNERRLAYYLKIWTPNACATLTPVDAKRLADAE